MALSPAEVQVNTEGRETVKHGTTLFPIACYDNDLSSNSVPWHWHDELEAICVVEGEAIVATDSGRLCLSAGEGCIINASMLHAVKRGSTKACRLHSLVFHPRLVGGSQESVFWHNYLHPIIDEQAFRMRALRPSDKSDQTMLEALQSAWQACANEPFGFEFEIRNCLSHVILLLSRKLQLKGSKRSSREQRGEERIKTMLDYMRTHLADEICVGDIARAASISESECLRTFRLILATSPIQYLRQLRLAKAQTLLKDTSLSVQEIGIECGFLEKSYFTRCFKAALGTTPTQYRAKEQA